MNRVERLVDDLDPGLSVRLRALKSRTGGDTSRRLIGRLASPGTVAVDIGANRGIYTHLLSRQVGPHGHVHAVEPVPQLAARLAKLARRRGNVTLHAVALSEASGTATLQVPLYRGHQIEALASLEQPSAPETVSVEVEMRTLDELLRCDHRRISFVKCDVEGHEGHVFRGAVQTLRRNRPVVLAEVEQRHRTDSISSTFDFFRDLGYVAYCLADDGLHPLAEFDLERDQLAYLRGEFVPYEMPAGYVNNFLFVPPGTDVSSLLRTRSTADADMAGKRRVLVVVENCPVPFDRRVWHQSRALAETGHDVTVISPQGETNDTETRAEIDGVHIHRFPLRTARSGPDYAREYLMALWHIRRLTRRLSRDAPFDAIHVTNPPDVLMLALKGQRRRGSRLVFDQHDVVPELFDSRFPNARGVGARIVRGALRRLEKITYDLADVVIVTNESYRRIALDRGQVAAHRVHVVRNGPDLDRFVRVDPRPELKRGRRYLACYLGVMGPQDGVDLAVRALAELRKRRDDVHGVFIGSGDAAAACRKLAADLGVAECVEFIGRVPDLTVQQYLSTADVCLAPDPPSPLNDVSTMTKIMEYMAMGCPVVSFDLPETRISAGDAAVYARGADVRDFAALISKVLDDKELRVRMGAEGRRRVEESLSWAASRERLYAAYDQVFAVCDPHGKAGTGDTEPEFGAGVPAAPVTKWEHAATTRWGRYLSAAEERAVRLGGALARPVGPLDALEIGCEGGRWSRMLTDSGWRMTCADVDPEALAHCAKRVPEATCVVVDPTATTLPAPDSSMSLVVCIEVAPVVNSQWFPREVTRVLRPGGVLVAVAWNAMSSRGAAVTLAGQLRGAGLSPYYRQSYREFRYQLTTAGLKIASECGWCWAPFRRTSNSTLIAPAAALERWLGLQRLPLLSPWVVVVARAVRTGPVLPNVTPTA